MEIETTMEFCSNEEQIQDLIQEIYKLRSKIHCIMDNTNVNSKIFAMLRKDIDNVCEDYVDLVFNDKIETLVEAGKETIYL